MGNSMRNLLVNVVILGGLIIGFYMLKAQIDPVAWDNFWTFMAGNYPDLYNTHFRDRMPNLLTNPLTLLFVAVVVLVWILKRVKK